MMNEEKPVLDSLPEKTEPAEKSLSRFEGVIKIAFYFSFMLFLIAVFFVLHQWKFGMQLLIISCCSISISGVAYNLLRPQRSIDDYALMLVFLILPLGYLFNAMQWPYGATLFLTGKVILLAWLLLKMILLFRSMRPR